MSYPRDDALVSTDWMAANLGAPGVKVVDASWYLPAEQRDPQAEYEQAHIPGAVRFDIDAIADRSNPLPHMFPDEATFARAVGALGIANADKVICYDGGSFGPACRAWWMFRAFGHGAVAVLNGGLRKGRDEGRALTDATDAIRPATYRARYDARLVRSIEQVMAAVEGGPEQILDARAAGRFAGTTPEPRAGMRSGHMPGAFNLPFAELLAEDGTVKPAAELERLFRASGIDLARPVVTSCGSGVTATVLLLGLHVLGREGDALYDGSWSEWGSRPDTPVVT